MHDFGRTSTQAYRSARRSRFPGWLIEPSLSETEVNYHGHGECQSLECGIPAGQNGTESTEKSYIPSPFIVEGKSTRLVARATHESISK